MFHNQNNFPFLATFKENAHLIAEEYTKAYQAIPELNSFFDGVNMPPVYSHFDYWVKESGFDIGQIGYDSRGDKPVGGFPLFKKGFPVKWMDVPAHFPFTMKLLAGVEKLHFAQFAIASPGSAILPHKHKTQSLIFHVNLFDLKGGDALFKVEDETFTFSKQGEAFLFDPALNHASENNSDSFRVTLMFEFLN